MYLKFIIALVSILAIALFGHGLGLHAVDHTINTQTIHLVPDSLGGSQTVKRWRIPQRGRGDVVETGAVFAAGTLGPAPVMLDFFRGASAPHNGIACFLIQGETLESQQVLRMRTASGTAQFDVGVIRAPQTLRLVAATECTASGCSASQLPFLSNFLHTWNFKQLLSMRTQSVVPAAVILTQDLNAGSAQLSEAQLRAELIRAVAHIDFTPARQLAAAEQP